MAKVQTNDVVSVDYRGPDRRRGGFLKLERWMIALVHSRWVASFIVAFAVSWGFHVIEDRADHKLEAQQRVNVCVIKTVALQQQIVPRSRISVEAILKVCELQRGK